MTHFDNILNDLKNRSGSKSEQGVLFERLIRKFFMTAPLYARQLENIWLWDDFPYNNNEHDTGIDLVAKTTEGEFWAIQCKFYDYKHSVSKEDIDSFLASSGRTIQTENGKTHYSQRYIVATTDHINNTILKQLSSYDPPVVVLNRSKLRDADIDWAHFSLTNIDNMQAIAKKVPRTHQISAINDVLMGFEHHDRGKLIMACGTGKTFTSLKIMEKQVGWSGNVLYLVPSIALLNQTLLDWAAQISYDFNVFAICSDPTASRTKKVMDDLDSIIDLPMKATTSADKLEKEYKKIKDNAKLHLFFSTYQSIDKVHDMQKACGDFSFDLIICDEAHRTIGAIYPGKAEEERSNFVRVHDNSYIHGKKRLYMTATPRVYSDNAKTKADRDSTQLFSMDDETVFGPEFHRLGFSEAVDMELLADYKVLILTTDQKRTSQIFDLTGAKELNLSDAAKIMGCWNGLSKKAAFPEDIEGFKFDKLPMKRAVAFCQNIRMSKAIASAFQHADEYLDSNSEEANGLVHLDAKHVDGTFSSAEKTDAIDWLKEDIPEGSCRILTNARCLSEGIDVPALDAVLFMSSKNSQVDIIQSVGRVMRKAAGKKYGYIILPIGITPGTEAEQMLDKNEQFQTVWQVLQALRAHDDRFDNLINKLELNQNKQNKILVGRAGDARHLEDQDDLDQLTLNLSNLKVMPNAIYARIVRHCGSRQYWEDWSKNVGTIAQNCILHINNQLDNGEHIEEFSQFLKGLQENLNSSITRDDGVEMLAEHMVTQPVFEALFGSEEFTKNNPVSQIMQKMLDVLDRESIEKEKRDLGKFYEDVFKRAADIRTAEGRQTVIRELYEKFFKLALPKESDRLGIIYTPIEVVDFILHSAENILQKCFNRSLADAGIHILDPFTGTGTFIVRLLQSGIIPQNCLKDKYHNDLHANEIVLLAYYIAAVNIEETYSAITENGNYEPFPGIVLTDTFELSEDIGRAIENNPFQPNESRAQEQITTDIQVIVGNPPYSVGQGSGNDNNQNIKYEALDQSIAETYVKSSNATLSRNLYDSYIRAFRWASNRITKNGIIGFVTNGSFIDNQAMDGFRKCIVSEFNSIYCLNLRGNQRTSGELSRKEGGKIFGSGSRAPIAITFLIKNQNANKDGFVHYYDIGDYLSREEKLNDLQTFHDISNIQWQKIYPDRNGDWINQRNEDFEDFLLIASKEKKSSTSVFAKHYSAGIVTGRDAWLYNFDLDVLQRKIHSFINFYNQESSRCQDAWIAYNSGHLNTTKGEFLKQNCSKDSSKIKWTRGLLQTFSRGDKLTDITQQMISMYRPFCKKYIYSHKQLIEMEYKWMNVLPDNSYDNLIICISAPPLKKRFSVLISNTITDFDCLEHTQCFPFYWYESADGSNQISLFSSDNKMDCYTRVDAITEEAQKDFQKAYNRTDITKKDIFYYIYGLLHSASFIQKYAINLSKEFPHIPFLKDFFGYSNVGKKLADLHLHYEDAEPWPNIHIEKNSDDYTVQKMRFITKNKRDTIVYNSHIVISNIPESAYDYIINGRSAIEWIMEQYQYKVDKASGIVSDPNKYAGGKYIFDLLLSVITVSIKTNELIQQLPKYEELG